MLQALINEYIESAQPVGSKTLVSRYLVDVSSATVRNELMWLEDRGYVISPHTSSGRVPTNVGYRCFVNSLLLYPNVLQVNKKLGELLYMDSGKSALLAQKASGESYLENTTVIADTLAFLSDYVGCLAIAWLSNRSPAFYHRGLALLMTQPEFRETTAALPLIQLLESNGDLVAILKEIQAVPGMHIRIGTEHADPQLFSFSMIASRAMIDENVAVIALFGPTRMDYRKAISALSAVVNDWKKH